MDFNHFVHLIAIGAQARIPMHMTGFPGVGKSEFTKSLEAGFTRAMANRLWHGEFPMDHETWCDMMVSDFPAPNHVITIED